MAMTNNFIYTTLVSGFAVLGITLVVICAGILICVIISELNEYTRQKRKK